MRSCKNI